MTIADRNQLERALQTERARVERLLTRLDPGLGAGEEMGRFGDDLASRATAGITRDDDGAVAALARRELEEIDDALRILDQDPKRYGTCQICGRPIALGRLALLPATRFCQRHANG